MALAQREGWVINIGLCCFSFFGPAVYFVRVPFIFLLFYSAACGSVCSDLFSWCVGTFLFFLCCEDLYTCTAVYHWINALTTPFRYVGVLSAQNGREKRIQREKLCEIHYFCVFLVKITVSGVYCAVDWVHGPGVHDQCTVRAPMDISARARLARARAGPGHAGAHTPLARVLCGSGPVCVDPSPNPLREWLWMRLKIN